MAEDIMDLDQLDIQKLDYSRTILMVSDRKSVV